MWIMHLWRLVAHGCVLASCYIEDAVFGTEALAVSCPRHVALHGPGLALCGVNCVNLCRARVDVVSGFSFFVLVEGRLVGLLYQLVCVSFITVLWY